MFYMYVLAERMALGCEVEAFTGSISFEEQDGAFQHALTDKSQHEYIVSQRNAPILQQSILDTYSF